MKKLSLFLIFLFLFASLAHSQNELKPKLEEMHKELKELQISEQKAATRSKKNALRKEIDILKQKIKLLEGRLEIEEAKPPELPEELKPKPAPLPSPSATPEPEALEEKEVMPENELGISLGYIAGIPAIYGEIRKHDPLKLHGLSYRFAVGYAQGRDESGTERKHGLIFSDIIYRLTPLISPGIRTYLGGGLNLDVFANDRIIGSVGCDFFLGFEGNIRRLKKLYLEIGYGTVRTGSSPDQTGLNATLGYRACIL